MAFPMLGFVGNPPCESEDAQTWPLPRDFLQSEAFKSQLLQALVPTLPVVSFPRPLTLVSLQSIGFRLFSLF